MITEKALSDATVHKVCGIHNSNYYAGAKSEWPFKLALQTSQEPVGDAFPSL